MCSPEMTARNKSERKKPARYIFIYFFSPSCVAYTDGANVEGVDMCNVVVFSDALLFGSSMLVIWQC